MLWKTWQQHVAQKWNATPGEQQVKESDHVSDTAMLFFLAPVGKFLFRSEKRGLLVEECNATYRVGPSRVYRRL